MSAWLQGLIVAGVVGLAALSLVRRLWPQRKAESPTLPLACGTACSRCRACK
ncbi:MAG: FeoB-associated Cys-rich membrane protein [Arenimonas sp.]|nr:FeoB-associated Cys-rich membrane protein [Arenimonas sp.]MBP6627316.1 FeoB-associated Cys-rich membrane protein [Arenimonas sp.]